MLLGGVAFSRLDCIENRLKWDGGSERPVANAQQKLTQVTPPPPLPRVEDYNDSIQFQHSISTHPFAHLKHSCLQTNPTLRMPTYYRHPFITDSLLCTWEKKAFTFFLFWKFVACISILSLGSASLSLSYA